MSDKMFKGIGVGVSASIIAYLTYSTLKYIFILPLGKERLIIIDILLTIILIAINIVGTKMYYSILKIVSSLGITLGLYNAIHKFILLNFLPYYVNTVADKRSYIQFSAQGAVDTFRIFAITIITAALVCWIKYVQVVRHQMEDI